MPSNENAHPSTSPLSCEESKLSLWLRIRFLIALFAVAIFCLINLAEQVYYSAAIYAILACLLLFRIQIALWIASVILIIDTSPHTIHLLQSDLPAIAWLALGSKVLLIVFMLQGIPALYRLNRKTGSQTLTNHVPIERTSARAALYISSVLSGVLAVLMLIAGYRWLAIEWTNDWQLSLSLALLGGSTLALAACIGFAWLARFAFKRSSKSGDA